MITIQISTQCYKINGNTLNTTFPFLFLQFFFIFCTCTLFFVVELISKSTKNNKNKHFDNLSLICCEFFFFFMVSASPMCWLLLFVWIIIVILNYSYLFWDLDFWLNKQTCWSCPCRHWVLVTRVLFSELLETNSLINGY